MPYKNPDKQREAVKLASKKFRKRRKVEKEKLKQFSVKAGPTIDLTLNFLSVGNIEAAKETLQSLKETLPKKE